MAADQNQWGVASSLLLLARASDRICSSPPPPFSQDKLTSSTATRERPKFTLHSRRQTLTRSKRRSPITSHRCCGIGRRSSRSSEDVAELLLPTRAGTQALARRHLTASASMACEAGEPSLQCVVTSLLPVGEAIALNQRIGVTQTQRRLGARISELWTTQTTPHPLG